MRETSRIGQWLRWLETERHLRFAGYADVWAWSISDLEGFWSSIWSYLGIVAHAEPTRVLDHRAMPGTVWFPGARLNYAEHVVRNAPAGAAIVSVSATRPTSTASGAELADAVARVRSGLAALGVGRGDVVAAGMPNITEAVVAFLATASLGAVWVSCPPEMGVRATVDRLTQLRPRVWVTVDGYAHRGGAVDRREEVAAIRAELACLRATVTVPYLGDEAGPIPGALPWSELAAAPPAPGFEPVPFAHPLAVLWSSGTTGPPKPIVHSHGGVLVEHLKMLALHHDLGPGDRFFWFTTTGWMMWNYLVSGLAVGAAIILFDGDPSYPDLDVLWAVAAEVGVTHFGTSASHLMACAKAGLDPGGAHDLSAIRAVGSTGSPLPGDGFRWVYDHVGRDLLLASISGGTDVCTAFVGAVPLEPVVAGEIACRCLGAAVAAFDDDGRAVTGRQANLVVTEPMPSMPTSLWGDDDGSRLRAAYFDRFPGVWDHGDWITITEWGTCLITGRSDATLNRGGVRIGTSELYAVVDVLPEIADSLAVHLEDPGGGPGEIWLFVQTAPGVDLDTALRTRLRTALRVAASPRHVPDRIVAVPSIPRTRSGKRLEVPVKRILAGATSGEAADTASLGDAGSLGFFVTLAAERASTATA